MAGSDFARAKKFFSILFNARLYFKTSEATREAYVARGMKPFQPNAWQTLSSCYEVPADVFESMAELKAWARDAVKVVAK